MGFITNIIILVIVLVIALSIVQVIFNPLSMSNLETALTNIGANVKSIAAPTAQNRAVSNCTAQVSSAMTVLSDKWFPDAQLSIVNTSIFSVNNTGQRVAVLISEPTSAVVYSKTNVTGGCNLNENTNPWKLTCAASDPSQLTYEYVLLVYNSTNVLGNTQQVLDKTFNASSFSYNTTLPVNGAYSYALYSYAYKNISSEQSSNRMAIVKNNLTIVINQWINYWAFETGEQGGINCYQNETRAGSYVCKDLEEIAQSNDTIAVGEVVRIAGNNNGQSYSIVLPVLCNAEGTLLPNSKGLLVSGSSNGDYLDQ